MAFWWLLTDRSLRPPENRSHTVTLLPAAASTTPPDGSTRRLSTGSSWRSVMTQPWDSDALVSHTLTTWS